VRFLVDAQLPSRLATLLNKHGHEAIHTSSLPAGNRSTDQQICAIADAQGRIVVTKDADFRNSHLLTGSPRRLLVVTTGNITNDALLELVGAGLADITHAFESSDFVELWPDGLIVHKRRLD
jgi:predicted nuclease of predicted toxin-antitoxin system